MITYYIYVLKNPINNEVFYVGCTANPKQRLYNHEYTHKLADYRYKMPYQLYILSNNIKPVMEIVDTVDVVKPRGKDIPSEVNKLEREWIVKLLSDGCPLTNRTPKKQYTPVKYSIGQTITLA